MKLKIQTLDTHSAIITIVGKRSPVETHGWYYLNIIY
jgi:hypothetical protein